MTVEQAIKTAIDYENRVRDHYVTAVERTAHAVGKSLFRLMADEEQHHVDYLEHKLREWRETGKVTSEGLRTALPSREKIESGVARLEGVGTEPAAGAEIDFLRKALAWENETSGFYRKVVSELPQDAKPLFARFLEIEEGHLAIVQAQIDRVAGTGYWFDVREFDLEG